MSGTPDMSDDNQIKPKSSNNLSSRYDFPDADKADRHGFLAFGGDLEPDTLLAAYNRGIFPWYSYAPIRWYSPPERQVIFFNKFHLSQSLKKTMRKQIFHITYNADFSRVMAECALQREDETWITAEMIRGYSALHALGFAASCEAWYNGQLVGGVYGVIVGKIFCAESMFYRMPSASKVALVSLVQLLQKNGFALVDCQVYTDNTRRFGAELISRAKYLELLEEYKQVL